MRYGRFGLIALVATIFAMVLATGVMAAATITWINPTTGSTLSGGANVNVSLNITITAATNTTACNFSMSASDTNATTEFLIGTNNTATSGTSNLSAYTLKFNSSVVQDTSKAVFSATCSNTSGTFGVATTVSTVIVDGGNPTAPTSVTPASKEVTSPKLSKTLSFSGSVTAADSTTCRVVFSGKNPGSDSYRGNDLGATATNCTITIANVPEGTYTYSYYAFDGKDSTVVAGGPRTFTVDYPSAGGKAVYYQGVQQEQAAQQQQNQKKTFAIIIAIVVIALIVQKNKKRR